MKPSRSISRILIANRGEIASRIIRTCRTLQIESVAVFSDIDRHMPFVTEADIAIPLGGSSQYLSAEAIVRACLESGANAVHPGYGFLSEDPTFPELLAKSEILFIGPSAKNIRDLGNKVNAKNFAKLANVPTSPTLLLQDTSKPLVERELDIFLQQTTYPLLIKAAAGGGGRGMRVVHGHADIHDLIESASREAEKSFGDGAVFLEKFISDARHIEVQIAGDTKGRVIALGTRDCTVQRNNQKIIEEAPATNLLPGIEEALCDAACRLAEAVTYNNVGTVEFLYTDDGSFYFLEVNTRLQVEHPVTELVTGVDLVALQIHLAQGRNLKELGFRDKRVSITGHAIEARICAETFDGSFKPSTGTIVGITLPSTTNEKNNSVRTDFGYQACCKITHHYDSLLGKLITYGPDRLSTIETLERSLANLTISGVETNKTLLHSIITNHKFLAQEHSIHNSEDLFPSNEELHLLHFLSSAVYAVSRILITATPQHDDKRWYINSPWSSFSSHHLENYPAYNLIRNTLHKTFVRIEPPNFFHIAQSSPHADTISLRVTDAFHVDSNTFSITCTLDTGKTLAATIVQDGTGHWIHLPQGTTLVANVGSCTTPNKDSNQRSESTEITSPLPATVLTIAPKAGDVVSEGDTLIVLDSMKMEHPIRSPLSGTICSVEVKVGDVVAANQVLLRVLNSPA